MTTTSLRQGALPEDDAATPSVADRRGMPFASALRALLEGARVGGASPATPGDRWLRIRIEEAIRGFDEIQEMDTDDRPEAPPHPRDTAPTPVILAPRARVLALVDSAA